MRTKNIFIALVLMVAAVLLSAPMASAAPDGPQSVLRYTSPSKLKLDKEAFDCKIASHKFYEATGVGTITFKGKLTSISVSEYYNCFYQSPITSVVIPEGVTSIGKEAFFGCDNLANVVLPKSLTTIEESAFGGCYSLTSITIPNSVTRIKMYAFAGCSGLTSITIGDRVAIIGQGVFEGCSSLTNVTTPEQWVNLFAAFANVKRINGKDIIKDGCSIIHGYTIISLDKTITSYTIPNFVTKIKSSAFKNCTNLTRIVIPDSVTEIGNDAFAGCSSLTDVTTSERWMNLFVGFANVKRINGKDLIRDDSSIVCGGEIIWIDKSVSSYVIPNNVTKIGNRAFVGCDMLESISIPASVKSIDSMAFYGCERLRHVNVANLDSWLCSGIQNGQLNLYHNGELVTEIVIPQGVTEIPDRQFANCTHLKSVTIPNSVIMIGASAFSGCKGLTNIAIPNSVTTIGASAFEDCNGLTNITIPNSVTTIGASSFKNCDGLTAVMLSKSLISIGDYAFSNCTKLSSITNLEVVDNVAYTAFQGCGHLNIYICDIKSWCSNNIARGLIKGYNLYQNGKTLDVLIIPSGVEEISEYAFAQCGSIKSVNIPKSVKSIGANAFCNCRNLSDVQIVDGVLTIGVSAFEGCSSLANIIFSNRLEKIDENAFAYCRELKSLTIPQSVQELDRLLYVDNFDEVIIYMKGSTPPVLKNGLSNNTFGYDHTEHGSFCSWIVRKTGVVNLKIYVPKNALFAYKTAEGWKEMAHKIYPIE